MGKNTSGPPGASDWIDVAQEYENRTRDPDGVSDYFRTKGLYPGIERIVGDCSSKVVLDAGCRDDWVLSRLNPQRGCGCDLVESLSWKDSDWELTVGDLANLPYEDSLFDTVVASLVLVWLDESKLRAALRELSRVSRPGGTMAIAIVHPYFYRTGSAALDGHFTIEKDLSRPFSSWESVGGEGESVEYHYRSPSSYLNSAIQAGFEIRGAAEWHVDMGDYLSKFPRGGDQVVDHILRTGNTPMFYFIHCRKELKA